MCGVVAAPCVQGRAEWGVHSAAMSRLVKLFHYLQPPCAYWGSKGVLWGVLGSPACQVLQGGSEGIIRTRRRVLVCWLSDITGVYVLAALA